VNGPCAGGGLGLALSCDIRIAAPTATFRAPFVHMGLVPDFGCSRLLPRVVGEDVALELLLTGRRVEAEEALRLGLVTRVAGDALGAALELAGAVAATPGDAARATKALVRRAAASDHATALLELEAREQGPRIGSPDFADAMRAWLARAHGPS
jgi:enoyl-CoA hydratase/carnithine racemase